MGCAPTNRKRTTVPSGQAHPVDSEGSFPKERVKNTDGNAEKNVTSLQYMQANRQQDKENKRIVTSTKLVAKGEKQQKLPFPDLVIKEQRRHFEVEQMDFINRQHLEPA